MNSTAPAATTTPRLKPSGAPVAAARSNALDPGHAVDQPGATASPDGSSAVHVVPIRIPSGKTREIVLRIVITHEE